MRWIYLSLATAACCAGMYFFQEDLEKLLLPSSSQTSTQSTVTEAPARIFAAGIVEGLDSPLDLRFEASGMVVAVHVKPGDRVRANQVLAEIDPTQAQLHYTQAESQFRIARAERDRVNSAKGGGSQPAQSSRTTRNGVVRQASTSTEKLDEEQIIADARVTSAEASVRLAQVELSRQKLIAPLDGTILSVDIKAGSVIGPQSMEESITMVNRSKTRVRAFVEELDAMDVAVGQQAVVVASGQTDREFAGVILSCAPYVQPKSHRHLNPGERLDVRVREIVIELEDGGSLLVGLPVEVFIDRLDEAYESEGVRRKSQQHQKPNTRTVEHSELPTDGSRN